MSCSEVEIDCLTGAHKVELQGRGHGVEASTLGVASPWRTHDVFITFSYTDDALLLVSAGLLEGLDDICVSESEHHHRDGRGPQHQPSYRHRTGESGSQSERWLDLNLPPAGSSSRRQVEGGFMQGLGLFTLEELHYSPQGVLLTRGPGSYKIPAFGDIPTNLTVSLLRDAPNERAVFSSKVPSPVVLTTAAGC